MQFASDELGVQPTAEVAQPLGDAVSRLLEQLHKFNIDCWLDSGTLLGVCRDGRPPTWDKDIDLGLWLDDMDRARRILREFAHSSGYRYVEKWLDGVPYAVVLYPLQKADRPLLETIPISIHVFQKVEGWALSAQPHLLLALEARYSRFMIGRYVREGVRRTAQPAQLWAKRVRYMAISAAVRMRVRRLIRVVISRFEATNHLGQVIKHPSERFGLSWLYARFWWRVPEAVFSNLVTPPGFPAYVSIPEQYDQYLSARYGDWKEPVEDWLYVLDDGLLIEQDALLG